MKRSSPRVAIASVGLGRIQRGYERYFNGIFDAVKDEVDVTLYKSAGPARPSEKVPPLLEPAMSGFRLLPFHAVTAAAEYKTYKNDCFAFALTMLPDLLFRDIAVVHVIDYPLAIALVHLRRVSRFRAGIIFSDGGLMPPQFYPRADHVHHVAQVHFDDAVAWGIPRPRMTMIPCGLHWRQFSAPADRAELRRKYGVAESTFVILAVAAVNRGHKRVDHLIREAAAVSGDILLWIDGRLEDPSLVEMAREKLGPRCRMTHVPSPEIPDLYHLANVFVHAAIEEGFGLAVCEAAAAGTMVLAHDSPHFQWLVGERDCLVDMSAPGPLACRLRDLAKSPRPGPQPPRNLAFGVRNRFDWAVLAPAYMEMYRRVAADSARN